MTDDDPSTPESESDPGVDAAAFRGAAVDDATAESLADAIGDASATETDQNELDDEAEPELALSQPLVEEAPPRTVGPSELRQSYGYVRAYFKGRPERYRGLQRRLKQARITDTYDEYLTTTVRLAALAALGTALAAVALLVALLSAAGIDDTTQLPPLGPFLLANPVIDLALAAVVVGPVLVGAGVWIGRNYYYPRSVVRARARRMALTMPHAVAFMYALSSGGMNFVEVCRRLADAEDAYGDVALEFESVVREIDLFGNDIRGALSNVRTLTASDPLRRLLDDLLGVLESGGDLEAFLEEEAEDRLEEALDEQAAFIETLGLLSEVFVAGFVAAPLFVIVVLMVVGFIGNQTVGTITLLVYVVFPLGMVAFLLLIDLLSQPFEEPTVNLSRDEGPTAPSAAVTDDDRFDAYRRSQRSESVRSLFADPARSLRRRPLLSLLVTVPAAVAVLAGVVATDVATPSVSGVLARPLWTTVALGVVPVVVATGPLAVLHERERRRALRVADRFPDVLGILASANQMGVDIVDAFDLVTRWTSGDLAAELRKVRNDIAWNHDLTGALLSLADRLAVPQLTRTMVLIAEGSRSTGDLHNLLEIAAEETRARATLARERRQAVGSYVAIVVLGFLVYLFVIVMIAASFFGPIAEQAAAVGTGATAGPVNIASIPVDTYQTLFLHSALIQGFGSGLLAGKLAENDAVSGLKYSIPLVIATVVAFALFV